MITFTICKDWYFQNLWIADIPRHCIPTYFQVFYECWIHGQWIDGWYIYPKPILIFWDFLCFSFLGNRADFLDQINIRMVRIFIDLQLNFGRSVARIIFIICSMLFFKRWPCTLLQLSIFVFQSNFLHYKALAFKSLRRLRLKEREKI